MVLLVYKPEDLHGYVTVLDRTCRTYGLPVELYGDRLNVFAGNYPHWTLAEELQGHQNPTHFGRTISEMKKFSATKESTLDNVPEAR